MMVFYEIDLVVLILINVILLLALQTRRQPKPESGYGTIQPAEDESKDFSASRRRRVFYLTYLTVYLLAVAVDWLQGPHIYAIYKYDKELTERTTAALYATGFISGAVSSAFVGQIADKYGRRTACLIYCLVYLLCCLSMLSDNMYILFLGRICGGIGTTLLYTSFEAWMITEYHDREMEATGLSLSTIFGYQATGNSVVAILSGVVGEALVSALGSRKAPFLSAAVVSVVAGASISATWAENYGSDASGDYDDNEQQSDSTISAVKKVWKDKRVLGLTIASSTFEGMMYLFVFFWTAAITSARSSTKEKEDPPYGLIFSCFMCAMMAGAQVFTTITRSNNDVEASSILRVAMTLASLALMSTIVTDQENLIFWAFCLVELGVGLYFPSMSFLKGKIIEDRSRAKIYSLMRVPLNGFVILAHSLAQEGDSHRNNIFLSFGTGIIVAVFVIRKYIE